jgi:hypothetical protein
MQAFENQNVWRWICALIVAVNFSIQGIAAASQWTTNQVYSPSDTNEYSFLRSVAYGDGKFVAVGEKGDAGLLFSSTNGINWTGANYGGWFGAVAYADGTFAVTGGLFGLTVLFFNVAPGFASGPTPDTDNFSITCGGGRVMIAYGNKVSYTTAPPGDSWTNVPGFTLNLTNTYNSLADICYGAGRYVAISAEDNAAHWTTTGRVWRRSSFPIPAPVGGYWLIAFNNGLFTVPHSAGTNLLSVDGTNWVVAATGISKRIYSLTFVNGLFAANAEGSLVFSKDGTNYVQGNLPPLPVPLRVISDGFRICGVNWRNFYAIDAPAGLLEMGTAPAQLVLYGAIGGSYRVEYADSIESSGAFLWHTLSNFTLPASPYNLIDPSASGASARFYRAVLTR